MTHPLLFLSSKTNLLSHRDLPCCQPSLSSIERHPRRCLGADMPTWLSGPKDSHWPLISAENLEPRNKCWRAHRHRSCSFHSVANQLPFHQISWELVEVAESRHARWDDTINCCTSLMNFRWIDDTMAMSWQCPPILKFTDLMCMLTGMWEQQAQCISVLVQTWMLRADKRKMAHWMPCDPMDTAFGCVSQPKTQDEGLA